MSTPLPSSPETGEFSDTGPIGSEAQYLYHLLDLSGTWGYYPAFFLHLLNTVSSFGLAAIMVARRNKFPFTTLPTKLYILTQMMCPIASFCYTHMMLYPHIPCWLEILASGGIYYFAGPAVIGVFHLWFLYNLQYSMSNGAMNTIFSRHSYIIRGHGYLMLLVFALWTLTFPFVFSRLVVKSPEILAGPFTSGGCANLSLIQLLAKAYGSGLVSSLGFALAFAMKDVKEAFHLKRQYKKVCGLFFATAPVVVGPWFLRELLPRSLYLNLLILGQLMWAVGIFAYTFFLSLYLVRLSYFVTKFTRKTSSSSQTSRIHDDVSSAILLEGSDGGVTESVVRFSHLVATKTTSSSGIIDLTSWASILAHIEKVSTVHEIRACLSSHDTKKKFKDYLVREFCVENMLFIIALGDFGRIDDPAKRLASAVDMCENYVSDGSTFQINISEKLRKSLLAVVQERDPSKISTKFFTKAEEEVYRVLIDPFNRFLHCERDARERQKVHTATSNYSAAGKVLSIFTKGSNQVAVSMPKNAKSQSAKKIGVAPPQQRAESDAKLTSSTMPSLVEVAASTPSTSSVPSTSPSSSSAKARMTAKTAWES